MVEKRQNKWLVQKQHLLFSSNVKINVQQWRRMKTFVNFSKDFCQFLLVFVIFLKDWQCFLFTREHFLSFEKYGENFLI